MSKKIVSIKCNRETDSFPDLSHYGTYGDKPEGKYSLRTGGGANDYRYFNADNVENMQQAKENLERVEAFDDGEWYMMGIIAEAILEVDGVRERITSAGLWGLESDTDENYLLEVEADQLEELTRILLELDFCVKEIKSAV